MFTKSKSMKLSAKQREELKHLKSSFPDDSVLGRFSPHTSIVEVNVFDTKKVNTCIKDGNHMPARQDLSTLSHEMTHWLDFFGTIWGRGYIRKICNAYVAVSREKEDGFRELVELHDYDRHVLAPAYYKYVFEPSFVHDTKTPWTIDYSAGFEFDPYGNLNTERPLFFCKFGDNPTRKNFARQPMSIGTLLEVRAVAAEYKTGVSSIATNPDKDEQGVERRLLADEVSGLAYNHKLIDYNVAVHLLSAQSDCKDIFVAYRLASHLAYLALNLQKTHFDQLNVPEGFAPFGAANEAFKLKLDPGYAFACMVFSGGKYEEGNDEGYIKNCLMSVNLPTADEILISAQETLREELIIPVENEATVHFVENCKSSALINEKMTGEPYYTIDSAFLFTNQELCPPFLDSEGEFIELQDGGAVVGQDLSKVHDVSIELLEYTRNFLTGCRGLFQE
ncbi:MAG: hypothetical protein V7776_02180 [Halopseudomonas aestusnigri]